MASKHLDQLRKRFRTYVDRGVFRHFHEEISTNGRCVFTFDWLVEHPFTFTFNEKTGTLQFKNLLPNAPRGSDVYTEVRDYIRSRPDKGLPAHRRIDPARGEASCSSRGGHLSLTLKVKGNQYTYCTTRLLNLTNEVFGILHTRFYQYMVENFDVPEE